MPSGSKKRKAARKKKENQSVSNHSDGDDDGKQQDDKDSDVGELSSPTSHDHNSHQNNLLTEGDEEENEKGEIINSHTSADEALKIKDSEDPSIVVEDDVVVPVDREFEIEDKSSKEADGSSSGSSSSSGSKNSSRSNSDDESHRIKKGEAAIDNTPAVELGSGHESLSGVLAENIISAEIDDGVDSVVENFPAEELKNISTLGDEVETDTFIAPYILEPMESDEKRLGFVDDNGISTVFMDAPLKRKDETIENIVTPDPKECVTQESHNGVAADIGIELEKDSGATEVLLPVPAQHPVQTTWKSCCGLFEVFARSGR